MLSPFLFLEIFIFPALDETSSKIQDLNFFFAVLVLSCIFILLLQAGWKKDAKSCMSQWSGEVELFSFTWVSPYVKFLFLQLPAFRAGPRERRCFLPTADYFYYNPCVFMRFKALRTADIFMIAFSRRTEVLRSLREVVQEMRGRHMFKRWRAAQVLKV